MAKDLADFDGGALAVVQLLSALRAQVGDFAGDLREAWPAKAITWAVESSGPNDWGQTIIDSWVELVVDDKRYVLWSLDIMHTGGAWTLDRAVDLNQIGESGNTIIAFDTGTFESFTQLPSAVPRMLDELFATRADVERQLAGQ